MSIRKKLIGANKLSITRRNFLRRAGVTSALALGAPALIARGLIDVYGAESVKHYGRGLVALELDGEFAGYLSGYSGGNVTADVITEKPGPDAIQHKHLAKPHVEPFVIEAMLPLAPSFHYWIKSCIEPQSMFTRKSGAIVEYDVNGNARRRHSFVNATITEIEFPFCDTSNRQPATSKVTFVPEMISVNTSEKGSTPSSYINAETTIHSMFRLRIMGLESATVGIRRIEPISVSISTDPSLGSALHGKSESPARIAVSNLVFSVADSHMAPLNAWHDEFVIRGKNTEVGERVGLLEYLTPRRGTPLFAVNLFNLGIFRISPEPAPVAIAAAAFSRVEMYCESISLVSKGL